MIMYSFQSRQVLLQYLGRPVIVEGTIVDVSIDRYNNEFLCLKYPKLEDGTQIDTHLWIQSQLPKGIGLFERVRFIGKGRLYAGGTKIGLGNIRGYMRGGFVYATR